MTVTDTRSTAWLAPNAAAAATPPPLLQIRPLRYVAEGQPGALPPIQGLRAQVHGLPAARCEHNATTGLPFFQELPAGKRRVLLTDPERRYLPQAITVVVPDRLPARPTAGAVRMPAPPRPTVLLRPAPGRAIPAEMTAIIGTLRDAEGHCVALGMLSLQSAFEGRSTRIVTWTDQDGTFAIWLPEEAHGRAALGRAALAPPTVRRSFQVHVPTPALAKALARDFLGGLPADLDGTFLTTRPDLFREAKVQALAADGTPLPGEPGLLPIRPARTQRYDLRLV